MQVFEEVLGELLSRLREDPAFDTEAFLRAHPSWGPALRERVAEFRAVGLLSAPLVPSGIPPTEIPRRLEQRYGIRGVDLQGQPARAGQQDRLHPGRLINGRYRVLEEIKSGGQARILRGH